MTVDLATVHHEGAGTPSDDPRGAGGGYTYWIGATKWERLRPVATSYATLHYNHVSLDICLSGDRMTSPVTDNDIALIHGAYMDALQRGEVSGSPLVRPHRFSPGSSTVCPGDHTMQRWDQVVAAFRPTVTPPKPPPEVIKVHAQFEPSLQITSKYEDPNHGSWALEPDGGVITFHTKDGKFYGGANTLDAAKGQAPFNWIVKPGTVVNGANPPPRSEAKAGYVYIIISGKTGARFGFPTGGGVK